MNIERYALCWRCRGCSRWMEVTKEGFTERGAFEWVVCGGQKFIKRPSVETAPKVLGLRVRLVQSVDQEETPLI